MSRSSCISPTKSSAGVLRRYGSRVLGRLPGILLRLEGLALLVASLVLYFDAEYGWVLLVVLFLAPDLSFAAYAFGPRIGALVYDGVHTEVFPIALGTAGLSAPGTLYAAMTAQVRSKQTLLPLLLFPLIVPALLASVKATSLIILGDPMNQVRSWIVLLASFDAIYWSLCGLLFGNVVEE